MHIKVRLDSAESLILKLRVQKCEDKLFCNCSKRVLPMKYSCRSWDSFFDVISDWHLFNIHGLEGTNLTLIQGPELSRHPSFLIQSKTTLV